jgi:hypothetical protein
MKRLYIFILTSILWLLSSRAQSVLTANGLAAYVPPAASGGGGGGGGGATYALVDSQVAHNTGAGAATVTFNSVGCKLLVASLNNYDAAGTTWAFVDNQGNTWVLGTPKGSTTAGVGTNRMAYCTNVVTTSATASISLTANYTVVAVQSFSYTGTTPNFEAASSGTGSDSFTTLQPGSLTPSGNNHLLLTGIMAVNAGAATMSINASFNTPKQALESGTVGAISYLIQGTAAAVNPTWTAPATSIGACNMISFF